MLTGAQAMVACLEKENIDTIYGYPGATICPFYDALVGSKIHHVLVRTEQNAAHAASGYARISGKIGVCVATSGPGATNLVTGIATAYIDSVPLVIITGQVLSHLLGHDVFQEADITGAAEPFTKHSYLVKDPNELPKIFKEAFHIASTGRPGPVLIDVPIDMQTAKIPKFDYNKPVDIIGYKPSNIGHPLQIKKANDAIEKSQKPLICVGGGVFTAKAKKEFIKFAENSDIPVVSTMMGISVLPSDHPLYLGMIGTHGVVPANKALNHADLILLVGTRVADRTIPRPEKIEKRATIIHIDIDPAEIGKNIGVNIPIVGDLKNVLVSIEKQVKPSNDKSWLETLQKEKEKFNEKPFRKTDGYVNPMEFLNNLSNIVDDSSIVVADVGQNQIWTANYYNTKKGRFLTSGGMGTMGYSVPCAVGSQMAESGKQVFAVCGDGSFQMNMMELATIVQEKLPVKIIIMCNKRLGMVKELQDNMYKGNHCGVFLDGSPDFSIIAKAYGIPSYSAHDNAEAIQFAEKMIKEDGPSLMQCFIDPNFGSI